MREGPPMPRTLPLNRAPSLAAWALLAACNSAGSDRPGVLIPSIDVPMREPSSDAARDAAPVDAPAIDAGLADAPALDAPALDAPALDAPALDAPGPTPPTDVPPSMPGGRRGLRRVRGVALASTAVGTPHATRLFVRDSDVVVLDSNDVQLVTDSGRGFSAEVLFTFASPRCTVGALNGAQVVCGAHGDTVVESVDLARRAMVSRFRATADALRGLFDIARQSDGLWIATADNVLEVVPFGADGAPDASRRRVVARGSFRTAVGDGATRVAAWDAATGEVSLFEGATLLRRVAVDGPLIGGRWRGGVFYAALGSAGVARLDPASDAIMWRVHPPAVATSVDLDDATLLVGSTTGAFAYALAAGEGRPFGFVPAEYGVLDVALRGGRALVLDWRTLTEFEIDPDGGATTLDTARGYLVSSDAPVMVPARNVGRSPYIGSGTTIAAGAVARFPLSASMNDGFGVPLGEASVNLVSRAAATPPRVGDPWPFAPTRFASMQLLLLERSCALQYPLWKELLYLALRPSAGDPVRVLGFIDLPEETARWSALWGLPGRSWSELIDLPAGLDAGRALGVTPVIGGPDTDAVYDLDATGRVVNFANQWRGRHALPSPL